MFPPRQIYLCFFFAILNFEFLQSCGNRHLCGPLRTSHHVTPMMSQTSHHTVVSNITIHKKNDSQVIIEIQGCPTLMFFLHHHAVSLALPHSCHGSRSESQMSGLLYGHTHIHVAPCTPRRCCHKSFPEADVEAIKSQFTGIFSDLCLIKTTR